MKTTSGKNAAAHWQTDEAESDGSVSEDLSSSSAEDSDTEDTEADSEDEAPAPAPAAAAAEAAASDTPKKEQAITFFSWQGDSAPLNPKAYTFVEAKPISLPTQRALPSRNELYSVVRAGDEYFRAVLHKDTKRCFILDTAEKDRQGITAANVQYQNVFAKTTATASDLYNQDNSKMPSERTAKEFRLTKGAKIIHSTKLARVIRASKVARPSKRTEPQAPDSSRKRKAVATAVPPEVDPTIFARASTTDTAKRTKTSTETMARGLLDTIATAVLKGVQEFLAQ